MPQNRFTDTIMLHGRLFPDKANRGLSSDFDLWEETKSYNVDLDVFFLQ